MGPGRLMGSTGGRGVEVWGQPFPHPLEPGDIFSPLTPHPKPQANNPSPKNLLPPCQLTTSAPGGSKLALGVAGGEKSSFNWMNNYRSWCHNHIGEISLELAAFIAYLWRIWNIRLEGAPV